MYQTVSHHSDALIQSPVWCRNRVRKYSAAFLQYLSVGTWPRRDRASRSSWHPRWNAAIRETCLNSPDLILHSHRPRSPPCLRGSVERCQWVGCWNPVVPLRCVILSWKLPLKKLCCFRAGSRRLVSVEQWVKGNMKVGQCVILSYRGGKHSARHVEERLRARKSLVSKAWVKAGLEKQI